MRPVQIQAIRQALIQKMTSLQRSGDRTVRDLKQEGGVHPADTLDRAQVELERIIVLGMREKERKLIQEIRETLARIDEGLFGICEACGKTLPIERIEAAPFSRLCIACQHALEKAEKRSKGLICSSWGNRYAA